MDFDFMSAEEEENTTSASKTEQTATGSNLTMEEVKKEARKQAASPKGLDIEAFQRKYKIHIMNVDELLKD